MKSVGKWKPRVKHLGSDIKNDCSAINALPAVFWLLPPPPLLCWWRIKIVLINRKTAFEMDCTACIMQSGLYNSPSVGRRLGGTAALIGHRSQYAAAEAEDWALVAWWIGLTDRRRERLSHPVAWSPVLRLSSSNTLSPTEKWLASVRQSTVLY